MRETAERAPARTTVIAPPGSLGSLRLRRLLDYRDLFLFLVWRDLKVRWAQTRVGAAWLVLQPLAMLAVYTFALSRIVETQVDVPYPLFAIAGITAWQFVSRAVSTGAESLVTQVNVIKRTGSPRILFPAASVVSGSIDFAISLLLFFVFSGIYGHAPTWRVVLVLPLLALAFALALGIALLLAPAHVRYRDVGRLLPFVVQLWFFLSPVAYVLPPLGTVTRVVEVLNPMVGLLSGFRWALLGSHLAAGQLAAAAGISIALLVAGVVTFGRRQHTIADDL